MRAAHISNTGELRIHIPRSPAMPDFYKVALSLRDRWRDQRGEADPSNHLNRTTNAILAFTIPVADRL